MRMIYFDIDSLNPNHLGCYGYHRPTSPNIDRIAREGFRFNRAYVSDSPCVPSRAATFSARYGIHNGIVTHWGDGANLRYDPDIPMWMEQLQRHGVTTISFCTFAERHSAFWFTAGWSEHHNHLPLKRGRERADEVNQHLIPWLRAHATEDFFLYIQYWDPHRNYRCPPEYMTRFQDYPPPPWPDQEALDRQQELTGPFTPWGLWPWQREKPFLEQMRTRADFATWINGYDGSIYYTDEHIGQVLEVLEQAGVLDQTALIVTADHGDHQGQQGIYGDHPSVYEATNHVPLIIRWPALIPAGKSSDALALGLDLAPTICELLNIGIPTGWQGRSLAPILRGETDRVRDHLVMTHGLYSAQRAVFDGQWKLVRTYHPGLYHFPELALFDLFADPHETRNLAEQYPDRMQSLDEYLHAFLREHLGHPGARPDPLQYIIQQGPWKYVTPAFWNERLKKAGKPPSPWV